MALVHSLVFAVRLQYSLSSYLRCKTSTICNDYRVGPTAVTDNRRQLGRLGEELAASFLQKHGCRIVQRNYRCSLGEVDIVVEDGPDLVFVEVRTKQRPCLFHPEETITQQKALRLIRLGEHYLADTNQQRQWRIDVVAVEIDDSGNPSRIERFKDATSGVVTA